MVMPWLPMTKLLFGIQIRATRKPYLSTETFNLIAFVRTIPSGELSINIRFYTFFEFLNARILIKGFLVWQIIVEFIGPSLRYFIKTITVSA